MSTRLDGHGFTGNNIPEAACAKRDDSIGPQEPAARCPLLDRQSDQFDETVEVDVGGGLLLLAL